MVIVAVSKLGKTVLDLELKYTVLVTVITY